MQTVISTQKLPISPALWEKTIQNLLKLAKRGNEHYSEQLSTEEFIKQVTFSHKGLMQTERNEALQIVDIYNRYFNRGKPESTQCYPCVRRAVEYIRSLIVKATPIEFEKS